ncbi:MAG: hypothetical protein ABIQ85_06885 [Cypionkella sp.]|jgi:hypothetical protein
MLARMVAAIIGGGVVGLGHSIAGGFGLGHAVFSYQIGGFLALGLFLALSSASATFARGESY